MKPFVFLLAAQVIYSAKDLIARYNLRGAHFNTAIIGKPFFWLIVTLHLIGLMLQLYVLSNFALSRAMTGFAAVSIVISSVLGVLILGESISPAMYLAILFALASVGLIIFAVK